MEGSSFVCSIDQCGLWDWCNSQCEHNVSADFTLKQCLQYMYMYMYICICRLHEHVRAAGQMEHGTSPVRDGDFTLTLSKIPCDTTVSLRTLHQNKYKNMRTFYKTQESISNRHFSVLGKRKLNDYCIQEGLVPYGDACAAHVHTEIMSQARLGQTNVTQKRI